MYNKRNYAVLPRTIGGFFEDMLHTGINQLSEEVSTFTTPVNIQETAKSYDLHLVAPGLKKEDIKLNLDRNLLTISYEHKAEAAESQEGKWIRAEFRQRSFKRSFTLNERVDSVKISAKYADGILVVTLPKKELSDTPVQEIQVS